MKKTALLTVLFLAFSFMGIAQEWHGITSASPSQMKKTLVSSTENEIVVEVSLGGFYTTNVRTPEGKQVIVSVDRMVSMLEAGAPDLPMMAIPAIIGDMAEMQVKVLKSNYVDFENIEVAPSKGNFSRQINPDDVAYTYGAMYQQDAFWPATQAYLEAPYILRDFRGQNIMVRPFAYNPVTKTLRVYTNMTIAMTKVSDNGENQKAARKSNTITVDPEFKAAYENRFINFDAASAKYPFVVDEGSMLVVCVDEYMSALQPLVDWKNISGRPCEMVASSVTGTDTSLKSYIQNYYNEHPELGYILLVGEHNNLPGHYMNGGRSDIFYGMLEGSDMYAEVLVGRFSPSNATDAANQANRTIYYERDVQEGVTWCNHGMGIGHTDGPGHYGETDWQHIDKIRDTLMHYTYTEITQRYVNVNTVTNDIISQDINNGISIANYCNHGSETTWAATGYSTSHVNALVNDYMLPYVISVACNNGQFDVGECFGESWMRSVNENTGAPCGAIGGMFSWISQPWQPPMYGQDEMNRIITEWIGDYKHTMGGVSINGSMFILDAMPSDNGNTYATWILFGDPSVMLRTDNPTEMDVTINPAAPMIGMTSLEVNADTDFGIATLSKDGEVLASAHVVNGVANLEFAPFSTVDTYDLVVIGYNRVTYVGTVEVLPAAGAYISVDAFTPGNVPVAEEQQMSMTFKNVGVDPTTGTTTVVLSSEDANITFTDNEGSFGVLASNETVTLENEFAFTVAAGVADGTKIQIDVTATCGANVWTGKAKITVGAPIMEFVSFQGTPGFEPGQTLSVAANFTNVGHYMATNAVVTATSTSSYVTFAEATAEIGTIDPEGVGTAVFTFTVDASCPTTEALPIEFNLVADNDVTATGSGVIKNSCVVVFALNDSYGDGWNGAQLNVAFSDGTPTEHLTLTSGQSSATFTMELGMGVHVTLTWTSGSWDSECSFTVSYEGGEQITSANSLNSSYNFAFDVACGGDPVTVNPVQNLEAAVVGNTVTLTWDAPADGNPIAYIIGRNGVDIATVTEMSYVDEGLEWETTYNYTIIAEYEGGVHSLPISVKAEIGMDAVDENEVSFGIYPNPAESVLNITSNASSFEYQMINSIGQVVMSGVANGNVELNVSDLNNGVYFVKVIANGNANIQKVVIK